MYGVIGDAHLGFRAYDTNRRSEECIDVFEKAVDLLWQEGITTILIPGDLIDDTTWPNWIEKRVMAIFRKYDKITFVIDGGNHDSTKTYSSVSALDVLEELQNVYVVNSFSPELISVNGLDIMCVPHMKSQKEFISALENMLDNAPECHALLLHCMVDSNLDLGPNDLNVETSLLERLLSKFSAIWIGHQHIPAVIKQRIIIPGSTLELNFGEICKRWVYICTPDNIVHLDIPQPRQLVKLDEDWTGLKALFELLEKLDPTKLYKLTLKSIPQEMYSQASSAIDSFMQTYTGDLITDLLKTGHTEIEISTIDAHFDLLSEFDAFYADNKVNDPIMRDMLTDAIAEIAGEEEDLVI